MTWFLRNWDQVAVALGQHVTIVLTALAIASVIALPVGIVAAVSVIIFTVVRSEERRVEKECRSRCSPYH